MRGLTEKSRRSPVARHRTGPAAAMNWKAGLVVGPHLTPGRPVRLHGGLRRSGSAESKMERSSRMSDGARSSPSTRSSLEQCVSPAQVAGRPSRAPRRPGEADDGEIPEDAGSPMESAPGARRLASVSERRDVALIALGPARRRAAPIRGTDTVLARPRVYRSRPESGAHARTDRREFP